MSKSLPTLVFDGDCGFCTSVAQHFEKRSLTPIRIVAWQLTNLDDLNLTEAQTRERVFLVTDEGQFGGAECFAELMRMQGDVFHRAAAAALRLPVMSGLAAWGYTLIARNRHRLPGGTPACAMPSAETPRKLHD